MLCQFCKRGFRSRRDYHNHVVAKHRNEIRNADEITALPAATVSKTPSAEENVNSVLTSKMLKTDGVLNEPVETRRQVGDNKRKWSERRAESESEYQTDGEVETYITRTETVDLTDEHLAELLNEESQPGENDEFGEEEEEEEEEEEDGESEDSGDSDEDGEDIETINFVASERGYNSL